MLLRRLDRKPKPQPSPEFPNSPVIDLTFSSSPQSASSSDGELLEPGDYFYRILDSGSGSGSDNENEDQDEDEDGSGDGNEDESMCGSCSDGGY